AEVEQTREADVDVEPEAHADEEEREQPEVEEVAFAPEEPEGQAHGEREKREELGRVGDGVPAPRQPAERTALRASSVGRDPGVDADLRARLRLGRRFGQAGGVGRVAHTFWMAWEPSSPVGRTIRKPMRRPKTTISDHCPPT